MGVAEEEEEAPVLQAAVEPPWRSWASTMEERAAHRETTSSRRWAPERSRSRSPAANQRTARLLPRLAVQFAFFFELFAGAASLSAAVRELAAAAHVVQAADAWRASEEDLLQDDFLHYCSSAAWEGSQASSRGQRPSPRSSRLLRTRSPRPRAPEQRRGGQSGQHTCVCHEAGCAGVDVDAQVAARPIARRLRKAAAPADPHFHRARRGRRWLTHGAEVRREPVGASVASSSGTASSSRSGRTRARSSTGVRFELRLT